MRSIALIHTLFRRAAAAFLCGVCLQGCERSTPAAETEAEESAFDDPPAVIDRLHRNQLSGEPTEFLRSRSNDPVHWQGWSPELFAEAESEQRLIFMLIGSAKFPETVRLLEHLRRRPSVAETLNRKYVCALVDTEAHPEVAIEMAHLLTEIRRPVTFPAMAWISHEGNPVAWIPLRAPDIDNFEEVFGNSDLMVSRTWSDSARYVLLNSSSDNNSRLERWTLEPQENAGLEDLRATVVHAARHLAALYDPATGALDGSGGLVPSTMLHFAGAVGQSGLLDASVEARLLELVDGISGTLVTSAIHDPLDDGFFSARQSRTWDLPQLFKTADTQSQVARAFAGNAGWGGDDRRLLEVAGRALAFADQTFSGGSDGIGSYEIYLNAELNDRVFYWSQERVRELLPAEEYAVVNRAFGLSGLGNLPMEVDPRRDYFRKNTLGMKLGVEEIAPALGQTPAQTRQLLDAACKHLHAEREELLERSNGTFLEPTRITAVNARFARGLAELARASGGQEPLQRARTVLAQLRARHYSADGGLLRIAAVEGRRSIAARGEDYSALLSALFAVYRLDLDPAHLQWAFALVDEAVRVLGSSTGLLTEQPQSERISILPIYSNTMLFGDSTWGTIYGPMERTVQLTGSNGARVQTIALRSYLLPMAMKSPLVHTDFLTEALVPLAGTVVRLEGAKDSGPFRQLHQVLLQPRHLAVTVFHAAEALPKEVTLSAGAAAGTGATVFMDGNEIGRATTAEDLEALLSTGRAQH